MSDKFYSEFWSSFPIPQISRMLLFDQGACWTVVEPIWQLKVLDSFLFTYKVLDVNVYT